jgi:hypothetical protein
MSYEERSAVESYINYRLKLASHPLASSSGSAAVPYTADVRSIADSVLECERRLLEVRLDGIDGELAETVEEHETARIATMRLREALALERLKLSGTHAFVKKARDVIFESSKLHDSFAQPGNNTKSIFAAADEGNDDQLTSSSGGGQEPKPSTVLDISTDVTLRRARLQDALSSACDVCPTVVYPTIMELLSQLAQTRRRVDYEKRWSDEVRAQLDRIQMEMAKMRAEDEDRKEAIARAKSDLDDAHREVFTKRKQYIVTHKRLTGVDRLPDGSMVRQADAQEILRTIRDELRAGRTDTLDRLASSECAELMGRPHSHAPGGSTSVYDRSTVAGGNASSRSLLGTPRMSSSVRR